MEVGKRKQPGAVGGGGGGAWMNRGMHCVSCKVIAVSLCFFGGRLSSLKTQKWANSTN